MAISTDGIEARSSTELRRVHEALARCLEELEERGEVGAPLDRAHELLAELLPALHVADADGARAAVLGCDLPTRELLDLLLRARSTVRRRRAPARIRADRERAADAALRALAEREDPGHPEDLDRRRQVATVHRHLLALLTDGVVTARKDGRLVHANRAARELLGLRLRDLRDRPFPALFARRAEGERLWKTVSGGNAVRGVEIDLRTSGGRSVPVRFAAARTDGGDARVLAVFRDLTEIRHIRSRLLETEKLGAMAKIAGSVAHEIRNPLNALFLNADLLEDELRESEVLADGIEEILRVMREEIERLNGIIKNYLSLSKLASANFERLDLNQVVREFVEDAEELASASEIRLDLKLARGEVPVRADRNMLRRVMVNLFQNAVDATPADGRIVIGTRRLQHRAKLWIKDNGPGLDSEVEEQVFQPFFSTKERGTGLGLYLSREIVMAHAGRVALRSIKPRGTQATVLLPRLREDGAAVEEGR